MENGFTSPRSDAFPVGLRVLVVDDDPTWLKILEKMLKKCSYEVTTCGLAIDALNLLRERKDGYDIVISDVNMPDMDGFKLLELVGLEMDLPVIMMSVDGETSRVMKGVQHGACDYLLKPIRMKELRNIWQHVFRKKIHEIKDIESHESIEGIHTMRDGSEYSDDTYFFSMEDTASFRKRKDFENRYDEKDFTDASTKKARVVWSVDLHQKFVKAFNQIGFDKVGPKKILDLMNVPWLKRDNVASHLQKYRLYLSRLQKGKENDLRSSFGGMKHSDTSSKDPSGSFSIQNATNMHNLDVANGSYGFCGENLLTQNVDTNSHLSDTKPSILDPISEPRNFPDYQKIKSSQMGLNHSFSSLEHEVNLASFDSSIPSNYSWRETSGIHKKVMHSNKNFSKLLPDPQHHIHVEDLQSIPSMSSKPSITENDILGSIKSEPSHAECGKNLVNQASLTASTVDSLPLQNKGHMVNQEDFEPLYASASSSKTQGSNLTSILESAGSNPMLENGQPFPAFDDDLQVLFQGDYYGTNLGTQNLVIPEYIDPGLFPIHLYDSPSVGHEYYPCDPTEYSVIDQGLFII